jgi:integrase
MPKVELTDKFCQSAKATGRKTDYFDTTVRGLCLRVSTGGAKSFYLVYSKPGGSRAWLKLAEYAPPDFTLAKARQRARGVRVDIGGGVDPVAEKKALAAGQTVHSLVENYLAREAATKRSFDEIARRLRKNISSEIGTIKLANLHRRDITACLDKVKDRGATVEANRVFEDTRAMVRWARGRGDLDQNIVEGMKRPSESSERDRVLTPDEIRKLWAALPDTDMRESTRRILRLCLVTAQRVGEISGMTSAELDLDAATWTIPAPRAKNGREHSVPLSAMAIGIIRDQMADNAALAKRKGRKVPPWIFPGPGARAAVTGASVAKAILRSEWPLDHFTAHDLRRTAATAMESIGVSPFVIGHVLNHVSVTKATITSRVYARHSYDAEKRAALDSYATWLLGILLPSAA